MKIITWIIFVFLNIFVFSVSNLTSKISKVKNIFISTFILIDCWVLGTYHCIFGDITEEIFIFKHKTSFSRIFFSENCKKEGQYESYFVVFVRFLQKIVSELRTRSVGTRSSQASNF